MDTESRGAPERGREAVARRRDCYCRIWDTDPASFVELGYAEGFCGVCERCGDPGHTRHFPGPVPYTGSWCDRCYRFLMWTWPFRTVIGWVFIAIIAAIAFVVGRPLFAAVARLFR